MRFSVYVCVCVCVLHLRVSKHTNKWHETWINRRTNREYSNAAGFSFSTFGNHNMADARNREVGWM